MNDITTADQLRAIYRKPARPALAAYRDQLGLEMTAEQIDDALEVTYDETLWRAP